MIRNCAKAGIPAVKYNMSILGVVRIGRTPGRGESTYSTWNYEKAPDTDKLTEAGPSAPTPIGSASITSSNARRARRDRREGAHGLPPARSRHAGTAGLSRRPHRAGEPGRA
jgi:D-mannonate dehydratase